MVAMSLCAVTIVGMSYMMSMGLGAIFGLKNNNLNSNIPFLLLGLGVDDAFVLASEFKRASRLLAGGKASVEDRIASAARTGGISILITSVTDAVAFWVGGST